MKPRAHGSQLDVDLIKAFNSRAKFRWGEFECTISREKHHPLVLSSGRIMVGDPAWFNQFPNPLKYKVPPGKYPVDAAFRVARKIGDQPDAGAYEDLALVRITFSKKSVAKWESATTQSGLPVMSRYDVVCYTDAVTIKQRLKEDTLDELVYESVSKDGTYSQIVVDSKTGANIVQVPSGLCACLHYPGRQGVFWGLDEDKEPVCLMTDFGAVAQQVKETKLVGSIGQLIKDKTTSINTSSGTYLFTVSRGSTDIIKVQGPDLSDIECTVSVKGKPIWPSVSSSGEYSYKKLPDKAELAFTRIAGYEPLI